MFSNFKFPKIAVFLNRPEVFLTFLLSEILFVTSWTADDAYHGFVMSRNLANGYGFVYNIGERVTASTCPLFSLILAGIFFITKHMSLSATFMCVFFSCAAFYILLVKFTDTLWKKVVLFFIFNLAQGFFSYANSGLENSLLFFLETLYLYLILSVNTYDFKRLTLIALVCSLLLMTRLDVAMLIFIPTAYIFLTKRSCSFSKMIYAGLIGLLPFILFSIFCIFYYGFLFPNTYYAKINTGFPLIEYFERGWEYIWISALYDPLLISIIILAPFFYYKKTKLWLAILIGTILKIMYIVYIGGDFMVCRHFSDLFWYSLCIIVWFTRGKENVFLFSKNRKLKEICILFLVGSTILAIALRPFVRLNMCPYNHYGNIADERAYYWEKTNIIIRMISYFQGDGDPINLIWNYDEILKFKNHHKSYKGALLTWSPGILVYQKNEDFYMQDTYALADPLLARLPAHHESSWRVGHIRHYAPKGYSESLKLGKNVIINPNIHKYYDIILSITRGELFSATRLKHIILFNLGAYDNLIPSIN